MSINLKSRKGIIILSITIVSIAFITFLSILESDKERATEVIEQRWKDAEIQYLKIIDAIHSISFLEEDNGSERVVFLQKFPSKDWQYVSSFSISEKDSHKPLYAKIFDSPYTDETNLQAILISVNDADVSKVDIHYDNTSNTTPMELNSINSNKRFALLRSNREEINTAKVHAYDSDGTLVQKEDVQ
ncbi:hypothetical protein GLW05_18875 [Pontibacillus yanchengensis]|uniref:DUF5590 domain-containing protein n=1 Tax=Pontibacillus yanchengensis TaxID=462910 RepID=A0A6I5A5M2_9BACI|nr:hypothetical protein [Pontibacillus yanchengensis]MYL35644.1 hypothetical protein [Pontibacillus yanchengensis]